MLIKWAIGIIATLGYLAVGFYPFNWVLRAEHSGDFRIIIQALSEGARSGDLSDYLINLFGFAPYGFVLFCLRSERSWIFAASLCLGVSLTIEIGQLLAVTERVPSFVDVALNTLGGMIGAWLGEYILSRHYPRFRAK